MYSEIALPCPPRAFHDRIYARDILRVTRLAAMGALVDFTTAFLEDAFAPHSPPEIHRHLSHAEQIERFGGLQRAFSSSSEVKQLWSDLFEAVGLPPQGLARDRLHLRFQPHQDPAETITRDRMTATLAFHRDTWGSNLYAQTNWWAPVYPITAGRTVAIYPSLWSRAVENTTARFDLAKILKRSQAGGRQAVGSDEAIPHLSEALDPDLAIPVVIEPGELMIFASAHAHAGVPNSTGLTRISLETRTLWIDDVRAGRGAPNVDGRARWMSPGLFRRVSDGEPLHTLLGMNRLEPYVDIA